MVSVPTTGEAQCITLRQMQDTRRESSRWRKPIERGNEDILEFAMG
ncbi:unnamed protein product [Brassica oleracea]